MSETPSSKWYHQIWAVLFLLFFVLGPLALPILWRSPHFPRWAKGTLTAAVIAATVWLILLIPAAFRTALTTVSGFQASLP